MRKNIEAASDRSGNRDACMRRVESLCESAMKFKDSRHSSVWKSAADPDCEDPPFITEYWSSTTLPSMRNPEDDIQQHVQYRSQGSSLKEHGHSSRVTSRKGFVPLSLALMYHRRYCKMECVFRTRKNITALQKLFLCLKWHSFLIKRNAILRHLLCSLRSGSIRNATIFLVLNWQFL